MPIYEYACSECHKTLEAFQKISDAPLTVCPECGGKLTKLMSNTSFVLKGGGWYADGYSSAKESKDAKPAEGKAGDAKKTDTAIKADRKPAKAAADSKA